MMAPYSISICILIVLVDLTLSKSTGELKVKESVENTEKEVSSSFLGKLRDLLPSATHHHHGHHGHHHHHHKPHHKDIHHGEEHAMKKHDFGHDYGKWKGSDEFWKDNKHKHAEKKKMRDRFGRQKYIKEHEKDNHLEYHRKKHGKFEQEDGKKFQHHEDKGAGRDKKWHWDKAGQKVCTND